MTKVFVSGPIHGMERNQEYRKKLKNLLELSGFEVLDPWERERELHGNPYDGWWLEVPPEEFIKRDLEDIEKSDVVVVYMPRLSAGSCMELFYAKLKGKSVWLISEISSPWVVFHADCIFKSIDEFESFLQSLQPI
jgi:nucleoside 2-deoxyribosyltransferase